MTSEEQAVAAALRAYQQALNASDTQGVTELYAPDGVVMGEYSPAGIGTEAIRQAYDAIFTAITLTITFDIAELRQLAAEWVMVRTTSTGTVRVKATGASLPEANQELFLFQKVGAAWKIARYCFNSVNPPPGMP